MSAMGSEMFMGLPAGLGDTRQLTHQGALPEADAAEAEAAHVGARSTADETAMVGAHWEALFALRLGDHRLLGH